jgi:alpha-tubulin suppressor-like RCC1 family protein
VPIRGRLGIALLICAAACDKTVTAPPLAFDLGPSAPTLFRGSTIRLDPAAMTGGAVATGSFKWSSSDTTTVVVDATGLITGRNVGSATIRALNSDGYGEAKVTVIEGGSTLRETWQTGCGISQTDNALYCWGRNIEGQVGIGNEVNPQPVPVKVSGNLTFTTVSPASDFTCGMTTTGPYCWGETAAYVVNDGVEPADPRSPVKVVGGEKFSRIESNGPFTGSDLGSYCLDVSCEGDTWVLTPNGEAYTWHATTRSRPKVVIPFNPVPVAGTPRFESISAGGGVACGITPDKKAVCWGGSFYLAAGRPGTAHDIAPGTLFQSISASLDHSCAIDISGDAYCWGGNPNGQLAGPTDESCRTRFLNTPCRASPVKVAGDYKYLAISAGTSSGAHTDSQPNSHTCGITVELDIVCWGYNAYGQLGNGTTTDSSVPIKVTTSLKFRSVAAAWNATCAVAVDGAGYCWGGNFNGQLGNGTLANSSVPVRTSGITFK